MLVNGGLAAAFAGQKLRQRRLAAELPKPVVDVFLQQRHGRPGGGVGDRLDTLPPGADQFGVPNVAVDGLGPAPPGGPLNRVVAGNHHQPPRGRFGADQLLDQVVGRLVFRGETDRDAPMVHHSRQPRRGLVGVEHHGRVRKLARIERLGQKIQQRQPAAFQPARPDSPAHDAGRVQQIVAVDQKGHGEGIRD